MFSLSSFFPLKKSNISFFFFFSFIFGGIPFPEHIVFASITLQSFSPIVAFALFNLKTKHWFCYVSLSPQT